MLAGLIIQKVTGRPLAKEMERRVIQRIGLRHTYFPAPGDMTIREPHPQGYYRDAAGAPLRDITERDPSWGWAAGQMISTNSDLNQFFTALLAADSSRRPSSPRCVPPSPLRTSAPAPATDWVS